ncbi:MAG: YggT family protein [Clostridiales bacterium]|jgi:uncharacterized protein YggT (Ycf19 family)|nr:YggT family protein [Clostridiales bacterium]
MAGVQSLIVNAVYVFSSVMKILLIARVLLSWLPSLGFGGGGVLGRISGVIVTLTEPIQGPIRAMLDKSPIKGVNTVVDFSPILSLFVIDAIALIITRIITVL